MSSSTSYPLIAIDGPAASGKSTFGKALAQNLDYAFVSTGSMYRGVTWYLIQQGLSLSHEKEVTLCIESLEIKTSLIDKRLHFTITGIDPIPHEREAGVNEGVSLVARVPSVRRILVAEQQKLIQFGPIIMEGRDIGTVVFPHTPFKFYIDADPLVRASRRQKQGELDSVQKRDELDQKRTASPLVCAEDAVKLDSGRFSVEELLQQSLEILRKRNLPDLKA